MSIIDSGRKDLHQGMGGTQSQAHLDNDVVQMVPQDAGDIRSENDLGFMTEVDAVFINPKAGVKESQNTDQIISTRHSEDQEGTSLPVNRSSV